MRDVGIVRHASKALSDILVIENPHVVVFDRLVAHLNASAAKNPRPDHTVLGASTLTTARHPQRQPVSPTADAGSI
jgi:hypothetical protein